jgi:oligopeptide transport system ATP-binding protein
MTKLLEISNLHVTFRQRDGNVHAVRGVDFSLNEGETIAIVGESGCGKSVTAKAILQLINSPSAKVDAGKILYNGVDLLTLSERGIRKYRGHEIGMIFQDPMTSLNPTMKVGKQVVEGILLQKPRKSIRAATKMGIELLKLVGIPQPEIRFQQYPHELSGGMRQRVLIATALATSPKMLIADEPTTALDVTIQAQILDLLKEIQSKTGTSILFITHDLGLVANFASKVLVMYAGKIVESASVHSLFTSPCHPYTKRLLASIPRIDSEYGSPLIPIEGSPPKMNKTISGCAFCDRCLTPMNICYKQPPPQFELREGHLSSCWLHDMRAKSIRKKDAKTADQSRKTEKIFSH